MNDVVALPVWAWTIFITVVGLLISMVAWFAKREIGRVADDFESSRQERDLEIGALRVELREARDEHRILERLVDRECINGERLREAMAPIVKQMDDLRDTLDKLFERLDGKQDKQR